MDEDGWEEVVHSAVVASGDEDASSAVAVAGSLADDRLVPVVSGGDVSIALDVSGGEVSGSLADDEPEPAISGGGEVVSTGAGVDEEDAASSPREVVPPVS